MDKREINYFRVLGRGVNKRCPHCGVGKLFSAWYTLRERCSACQLPFEPSEGSTRSFMHITTAGITGLVIVIMLLLGTDQMWVWRFIVLPIALMLIGGTMPVRKSIAVAVEYLFDILFDRFEEQPKDLNE